MNAVTKREPETVPAPQTESTALISMIERAARDPSVDIDKMERLMKMHSSMVERQAKMAFDAALAAMQPDLPVVGRHGKIEIKAKDTKGERNGAVQQSTSYALWEDINEAIRPSLKEHGFALSFRTGLDEQGRVTVTGILSHREGHREETTMTLQHDSTGSKNAVQAVGSSLSYGKRYTATALLNITSRGEDDGAKAAGAEEKISDEQLQTLIDLADEVDADKRKFCEYIARSWKLEIGGIADIPASKFEAATKVLEAKRRAPK